MEDPKEYLSRVRFAQLLDKCVGAALSARPDDAAAFCAAYFAAAAAPPSAPSPVPPGGDPAVGGRWTPTAGQRGSRPTALAAPNASSPNGFGSEMSAGYRSGTASGTASPAFSPRTRKLLTGGLSGGDRGSGKLADYLFDMIDRDNSGSIEVQEIVSFMKDNPDWVESTGLHSYTEFLQIIDADQSGMVDRAEFRAGLARLRDIAVKQHAEREFEQSIAAESAALQEEISRQLQKAAATGDADTARQLRRLSRRLSQAQPSSSAGEGRSDGGEPRRRSKEIGDVLSDRRGASWRRSRKMLGRGAFGEVWLGMYMGCEGDGAGGGAVPTGAMVAMKTLPLPRRPSGEQAGASQTRNRRRKKEPNADEQVADLVKEVGFLTSLRHPNCVAFLSSMVTPTHIVIVTEYLSGGSLMDLLEAFGALGAPATSQMLADVLKGLAYLHGRGVVHRDIKPHNVLLHAEDATCKLTDFGTCKELQAVAGREGPIGTPLYMSPEAAKGAAGAPSDIWGVGVMTCQLLTGQLPWNTSHGFDPSSDSFNIHAFMYKLGQGEYVPEVPPDLPKDALAFLDLCLLHDPAARAECQRLLLHAFIGSRKRAGSAEHSRRPAAGFRAETWAGHT